jgi:hypothetical protein
MEHITKFLTLRAIVVKLLVVKLIHVSYVRARDLAAALQG